MDKDRIEALAALLAASTPGPWQSMNEYQRDSIIGDIDGPDDGDMRYESVTDITSHHDRSRANARLIVAMYNSLPELLRIALAVADGERTGCSNCDEGIYQGTVCEHCDGTGYLLILRADAVCTEPSRADCPRLCQDFCNEAETRVAEQGEST